MRKKAELRIELRSDLCTGSGYGYAGVLDTDVVYDAYGLPLIPARRLKGCMREAAQLVCAEGKAAVLFGRGGEDRAKGIVLGNAYIEHYRDIVDELQFLERNCPELFRYLSQQRLLDLFTSVRGQTKINRETGIAEDNTLRYIRVVGQYDPLKRKPVPLCFRADLEYDGQEEEEIEKIIKAVRNIGMNRNRGLGSVRCSIKKKEQGHEVYEAHEAEENEPGEGKERNKKVCINYILNNCSPLLMSSDSDSISDSYISGKSILGRLAGAYLETYGKERADGEEFKDLFLNGSTIFTDANVTLPEYSGNGFQESSKWKSYFPAPLYINRTKKTEELVNILKQKRYEKEDSHIDKGNLPKKLRRKYVCEIKENAYHVTEVDKEIVYHHGKNEREREDGKSGVVKEEGKLYYLEAVKEGQYFKGRIYTDWKYAPMLKKLLLASDLRFGKSKTIQYGSCGLPLEPEIKDLAGESLDAAAGTHIVVTFCSDAVFMDENGYTVEFDKIKQQTAEKLKSLGIDIAGVTADDRQEQEKDAYSIVQTKEVSGYNTKWNLRRPGIPAVKAGSTFVYKIGSAIDDKRKWNPMQCFAGERNLEGYGEFKISSLERMKYDLKEYNLKELEQHGQRTHESGQQGENGRRLLADKEYYKDLLSPILSEEMLELLTAHYIIHTMAKINLNPSTIGHITLMLEESLNPDPDLAPDPKKAFQDFCDRIMSIRRPAERKEAIRFLKEIILKETDEKEKTINLEKMERSQDSPLAEIKKICGQYLSEKYYEEILEGLWGRYLMTILTYHKYQKSIDRAQAEAKKNEDDKKNILSN